MIDEQPICATSGCETVVPPDKEYCDMCAMLILIKKQSTRIVELETAIEAVAESGGVTICKVCGLRAATDVNGYCTDCYPYDGSTDKHKVVVETQQPSDGEIRDEIRYLSGE